MRAFWRYSEIKNTLPANDSKPRAAIVRECVAVSAQLRKREAGLSATVSVVKDAVLVVAVILAAVAGWLDWRFRRIPNWLTIPGLVVGIAMNALASGWQGAKASLLGTLLGLGLLMPFVLVRSLGGGDWKLIGALGAFLGPGPLFAVLLGAIFVAGAMALGLIIYKRRVGEAAHNIGRMLAALFSLRLPGPELTLDNPRSLKVPFGVAVALTVILYGTGQLLSHGG